MVKRIGKFVSVVHNEGEQIVIKSWAIMKPKEGHINKIKLLLNVVGRRVLIIQLVLVIQNNVFKNHYTSLYYMAWNTHDLENSPN